MRMSISYCYYTNAWCGVVVVWAYNSQQQWWGLYQTGRTSVVVTDVSVAAVFK